jgi:hypothetical protein
MEEQRCKEMQTVPWRFVSAGARTFSNLQPVASLKTHGQLQHMHQLQLQKKYP